MADIQKSGETERFEDKEIGFNLASNIKKEADISTSENGRDPSLIRIKTEPSWITDCDITPTPIHLMGQKVDSFETMWTAVKEEVDSGTDTIHNNVTVHLSILGAMLTEKADVPPSHSVLPELREDSINLDANFIISENVPSQNVPVVSTKILPKQKSYSDVCFSKHSSQTNSSEAKVVPSKKFSDKEKESLNKKVTEAEISDSETAIIDLESSTIESSPTELSETVIKPVEKSRGRKRGSLNNAKTSASLSDSTSDYIDLDNPALQSSATEFREIVLETQQPKRRGRKPGTSNNKKTKTKEIMVCPFCDKRLAKHYFPYHARVHTDEKPFKCPKCSYTSHFKGPLQFHMDSHHPTEGYVKPQTLH